VVSAIDSYCSAIQDIKWREVVISNAGDCVASCDIAAGVVSLSVIGLLLKN
jgi:hypothetical protein